jgi:hypothetical protein
MRRVALAVAFLLAGCSSSYESRTLVQEADGGVTENPVMEADAAPEGSRTEAGPECPKDSWPQPPGCCSPFQGCYLQPGNIGGVQCWIGSECGCMRLVDQVCLRADGGS